MIVLLAGIINPRRACAARVTVLGLCVCVCVCVTVTQHLTFHVIISATNDTNSILKVDILSVFLLRCEARAFPVGTAT